MTGSPFSVGATFYVHGFSEGSEPSDWGHTTDGGRVYGITRARYAECNRYHCRPVVVIDPEDREQVERLADAWKQQRHAVLGPERMTLPAYRMQAALRSLIAPPKPPEPQGLGAVVEDAEGVRWVRDAEIEAVVEGRVWSPSNDDRREAYAAVVAVRVLSEGVTK